MEQFLVNPIKEAQKMPLAQLEKIIETLKQAYYNDQSIVSDQVYDQLEEILKRRKPDSHVLKEVGAEIKSAKVKLPYWMGSLDKIKPATGALENWVKRFPGPYLVSHKLDGISALLTISQQNHLFTRGNGSEGQDISHLIPYLGLAIEMDTKHPVIAIRGEIIMSKQNWLQFSAENSNARNMVSGLVNAKKPDLEALKAVDFVAYEIIEPANLSASRQFSRLAKWGFKVAEHETLDKLDDQTLSQMLSRAREQGRYQIDGLILTQDQPYKRNQSGNPKYSIAFKSNSLVAGQITTVRQVIWSPTRHGYLKPRIEVDPIQVGDQESGSVTITYCTAFNAQYIVQNQIGPGSLVEIVRSGDVIPFINSVILGTGAQMPLGDHWTWNPSKVDIILKDPENFTHVNVENLTHFFKTMGARYVSGATIKKFVEAGLATVSAILLASTSEIAQLPGLGGKSAERIRSSLDNLLVGVEPARLMAASGAFGHGLGIKKLGLVLEHYPDCLDWQCDWIAPGIFSTPDESVFKKPDFQKLVNKIIKIPGFQTKTAHKFVYNLPNFQEFLAQLPEYSFHTDSIDNKEASDTTNDQWRDQRVVFSGFRNAALEKAITTGGGQVTGTVTSKTTLVLIKDHQSNSSKVQKAHELGIPVKTIEQIF